MKRMKKFAALSLAAAMTLSVAGCGGVADNTVFSVDDLAGKTIGVQLGTTGDIYASDYADEQNAADSTEGKSTAKTVVERYNKGADAVQALKQGKADCVIIDEQPAQAFVEKNDDLKILDEAFADEEYAMCIAKDNTELTDAFNGAIEELKKDGTLDSIIKNYIGDDTKGKTPYESPADVDRSNGTLVMATNAQFEPYEFYKGEDIVGIDVDFAQAICDKLGYELKVEDMEFDSIISAVQSGKADFGAAGMTVTEDRLKNIDFTDTYATARQVMIVRSK
ncbi:MAG: transporter substrate-binding domain-containing protein [Lachnospiraceae bacterium]|nr:transporter substrate-binding domain-containing protein [Lachnospiraceae bacterium]